jgi:LPXTG-site transpeptidase (sortase) family protein
MIRVVIRGLGELLITVGVVVLLFAAYEVYGKAFEVHADQSRLDSALDRQWGQQAPPAPGKKQVADKPIPGQGVARLYIPRLAKEWVVVEGVSKHDIKLAPGHYPDSQLPGQVGNFAVAGHRMPSVFWDIDQLHEGDSIVVETRTSWDVYRVTRNHIIRPTQVSVVAKNPDHPGTPPTRKLLTLTTCNPKWDNYQRMIVWAEQIRTQPQSAGKPAEVS